MKIGVVGATGLVGQTLLEVAQERTIDAQWFFFASNRSANRQIFFQGRYHPVHALSQDALACCDLLFMLTPGSISQPWIDALLRQKSDVMIIDNASTYRLKEGVPLLIPEINPQDYHGQKLIANPNCVTIQLLLAMAALQQLKIESLVLTSFQSVSGSGFPGLDDLKRTQHGLPPVCYPYPIWDNVLPQCDLFDGSMTLEEKKIINESEKILHPSYAIYPTCVRVPVSYGHQLSLTLFLKQSAQKDDFIDLWSQSERIEFREHGYALNTELKGSDSVFISRLRSIDPQQRVWQCWVGADNLRVGAASNALNIAKYLGLI